MNSLKNLIKLSVELMYASRERILLIKADNFRQAVAAYNQPLTGTYIYNAVIRDHIEKTSHYSENSYEQWFRELVPFLKKKYNLAETATALDFGCGTGELTVLLNQNGLKTTGIDLHSAHLGLAKILASENDLPEDTFILSQSVALPFPDQSFDIIFLFVVLEHLSDKTLLEVLPELKRLCRSAIYVLVPNKLQTVDDHTGLRFVPWLPRSLANIYVKLRGEKYRYSISVDESWDVYYRTAGRIAALVEKAGFRYSFIPDELVYPPLTQVPSIFDYSNVKTASWRKPVYSGLSLLRKFILSTGCPTQALYPYLNIILEPKV